MSAFIDARAMFGKEKPPGTVVWREWLLLLLRIRLEPLELPSRDTRKTQHTKTYHLMVIIFYVTFFNPN
ncbi:MAG TPA: hypothetical protein VF534_35630 [Paraburkholderia sp.]